MISYDYFAALIETLSIALGSLAQILLRLEKKNKKKNGVTKVVVSLSPFDSLFVYFFQVYKVRLTEMALKSALEFKVNGDPQFAF